MQRKHGNHSRRCLLFFSALAAAFMLVPAAVAFATPHFKLNVVGTGSGEVTSVEEFPYEQGTPPIACKYNGTSPSGVCENEPIATSGNTYGIELLAVVAPGSKVVWTFQKGSSLDAECPFPGETEYCLLFGKAGEETLEATATFTAMPFKLKVNVNGGGGAGTVTSSPSGINCSAGQECSAAMAGAVTLTAHPAAGYLVAGWVGCRQSSATTCLSVPGTENEEREVTAILLKEGEKGSTGSQGPQGAAGATGAQGPAGSHGNAGAIGAQGPAGPAGVVGAQGPAGPRGTEGKVMVTCKVSQSKGKKAKVACTVKQSASAASVRARVRWSLHRNGRLVSHGDTTTTRLQYALNHLRHGRYALHIAGQQRSVAIEVN